MRKKEIIVWNILKNIITLQNERYLFKIRAPFGLASDLLKWGSFPYERKKSPNSCRYRQKVVSLQQDLALKLAYRIEYGVYIS